MSANIRRWFPVVSVLCFIALGTGRALTTTPWNDEWWYSAPSWSLIQHGNTGTPGLETAGEFWKGIDQRTYWVVPLQFFAQVPWFMAFGFSLLSARFFAMAWGAIGILCWGLTVRRITGGAAMGYLTMLLLAFDYQYVSQMALDRMDAMSLGLAALGITAYFVFREKNFPLAIWLSHAGVVACGLTHPTPGVPAFCAVLFVTLLLDRSKIRWQHLLVAAVPYLLGAAFWYWYIAAAPDLFRAQFLGNVTDMDRLGGFRHPLRAIAGELKRYAGMGGFASGQNRLYRIKSLVVLVSVGAAIFLFMNKETRKDPRYRPILGLWLVYVLVMTFYDNTKDVKYAVHLVPLYDGLTAIALVWLWRQRPAWRWLPVAAAAVFLVVSAGGSLYTTFLKDDYHKKYLPAANYVRAHTSPGDLIIAGSEFGFALGFDRNILDDEHFTFDTHKTPKMIVLSENYKGFLEHDRISKPAMYNYAKHLFAEDYRTVYSFAGYDILQRKPPG